MSRLYEKLSTVRCMPFFMTITTFIGCNGDECNFCPGEEIITNDGMCSQSFQCTDDATCNNQGTCGTTSPGLCDCMDSFTGIDCTLIKSKHIIFNQVHSS